MKVNFKKFMVLERLRDIKVGRILNPLNLPKNLKAAYNYGDKFTKDIGKARDILQGKATFEPGEVGRESRKKSIVDRNRVFSDWRDKNINNMGTYQTKAFKELKNYKAKNPSLDVEIVGINKFRDTNVTPKDKIFSNIGHYANQVMDKYVEYRNQRGYSEENAGQWVAESSKFSPFLLKLLKRYGMLYPAIARFVR